MRALLRGAAGTVGAALLTIACSYESAGQGGADQAAVQGGGDQAAGQGSSKAMDLCPAKIAYTSADITADFSLPITVAQTGVFHACRNNGCLQIALGGSGDFFSGSASKPPDPDMGTTVRVHNDPSREPYVELTWSLWPDPTSDYTRTDLYTLSVDHDGITTELLRASTTYAQTFYSNAILAPDPTVCGSWGAAVVDLRTASVGVSRAGASGAGTGGVGASQ